MSTKLVRVLLVGESAKGFSHILQRLQRLGCECCVATSSLEAARVSVGQVFDLVLCTDLEEGNNTLIASLIGRPTTLFRCYPVEDSCWWLPALRNGAKCLGAPALRPSEFASAIEEMLEEIQSGKHPRAEAADWDDKRLHGDTDAVVQRRPYVAEVHAQPDPNKRDRP